MSKSLMCPFYGRERRASDGSQVLYCENLRIKFKSKKSRRRYVRGFCAGGGYSNGKECTWHAELMRCYEEKDGK